MSYIYDFAIYMWFCRGLVLLLLRLHMIKQKLRACTWFVQALKMMLSILSMPMF